MIIPWRLKKARHWFGLERPFLASAQSLPGKLGLQTSEIPG